MFKKLVLTAALVMSVPALASASWYLSATTSGNGTVTAPDLKTAGLNAIPDTTLTETLTVTPAAGNYVTSVRLGGVAMAPTAPGANTYVVSKTKSAQYVTAYFAAIKATVNASVVGNGAISPVNTLTSGQNYTVNIKPNSGNVITSVVVDGVDKGAITTWTWPAIAGAHTIVANFQFQPTVTASVSAAGTLAVGSTVTLNGVASTNDTGFTSYSFLVNGSSAGVTQASATVPTATFTPATAGNYAVTFTANTVNGGTGSVNSNVYVLTLAQASYNACVNCHSNISQAPHTNTGVIANTTTTKAQFLSSNQQCSNCHGSGMGSDSPGLPIMRDYAESAHGATDGEAWTHYDFKQSDRAACQQCHTTTGFIKYVTNGYVMATAGTSWGTTGDTTKEVLGCNACHTSSAWTTSVRAIASYTVPAAYAPYAATYTAATSNLCIVCHSGQASKANVDAKYATNVNNTNVGLVNSHYLAAATTLYKTSGYTFYADPAKYANKSFFKHDKLGMNNYSAVSYTAGVRKYDYSQNTGVNGPCVACHMNGTIGGLNAKSHTLDALEVSKSMPASNGAQVTTAGLGCYGCHGTENMTELIEGQKAGFQAALTLLKQVFAANNVDYDPGFYPYFFATGTDHTVRANGVTNWTFMNGKVANGNAKLTHGAAFNLNLLTREPGAFAHNRYYSKRLIYDSLDYLQNGVNVSGDVNGVVNFSNLSSATTPVSAARAYLGTARP